MADETILESLVVRLTGDGSMYQKMLEQAGQATKAASTVVEAGTKAFDQLHATLSSGVTAVTSYIASWSAFSKLEGMFNKFVEHEDVELKLKAAIEANGQAVEETMKRYKEFAGTIANVTTRGKDSTLAMLQQAEAYGLSGEKAERAVRNVIAAQAAGLPRASMRIMAALEEGTKRGISSINMLFPKLASITDPTEKAVAAQAKLAAMFKVAEAEAQGAGGQIKQLQNAYSGLQKELGEILANAVKPVVSGLKDLVGWFRSLSGEAKNAVVVVTSVAAGIVTLTGAIALAGVVFNVAFGGSGLLIAGIAVGLAAAAGGAALLVRDFGGVAPMMDYLKKKATEFWDWIAPVRSALTSLFTEFLGQTGKLWGNVKSGAGGIFQSIFGDVDWSTIRTQIVSAIAVVEQVVRNLGTTATNVWGDFKGWATQAAEAVGSVIDHLSRAVKWVGDFAYANRGLILTIVGIYGAFKAVQLGIAGTVFLMQVLHVDQLLSTVAWVIWAVAVTAARAAMFAFITAVAISQGVVKGLAIAIATLEYVIETVGIFLTSVAATMEFALAGGAATASVAMSLLAGAITAVDVALTVLETLTGVIVIALAAAAVAAVGLVGTLGIGYSVIMGVVGAATALFDVLVSFPTTTGPIASIVSLFGEWQSIFSSLIEAMRKDMPLAWELVKYSASLAVEEIKAMWEPLGTFVADVFDAVWTVVARSFAIKMRQAAWDANDAIQRAVDPFGLSTKQLDEDAKRHAETTRMEMEIELANAKTLIAMAGREYHPDLDNPAIRLARQNVEWLRDEIAALPDPESKWKNLFDRLTPPVSKTKDDIDKHMDVIAKGVKEGREKVDFVLAGSVEAALHVAEYRAMLEMAFDKGKASHPGLGGDEGYAGGGGGGGGAGLLTPSVAPSPALPSGAGIETADTKLLRGILTVLEAMAAKDSKLPTASIAI